MYQENQHGNKMLRVKKIPSLGQKLNNAACQATQATLQRQNEAFQAAPSYSKCPRMQVQQVNCHVPDQYPCWAVKSQLTKPLWEAAVLQCESVLTST